jgi:hypothetical protein
MAGLFDVLENLVSFFMINDPANFINAVVVLYSTFAWIKFLFWGAGLMWLLTSVVALVINKFLYVLTMVRASSQSPG